MGNHHHHDRHLIPEDAGDRRRVRAAAAHVARTAGHIAGGMVAGSIARVTDGLSTRC